MSNETDDMRQEIERIQYDFEEAEVTVKCLKTKEEFDMGSKKIKLNEGSTLKLPFWIAYILSKEGYIEFDFAVNIDFPNLYKMAMNEQKAVEIQKVNPFLYIIARETFKEFKEKGDSYSYRQIETTEMKLRELMTLRLSKIVKMAEKGKNITTKGRNLTIEEKWLYDLVADAVERWKKMVKEEREF